MNTEQETTNMKTEEHDIVNDIKKCESQSVNIPNNTTVLQGKSYFTHKRDALYAIQNEHPNLAYTDNTYCANYLYQYVFKGGKRLKEKDLNYILKRTESITTNSFDDLLALEDVESDTENFDNLPPLINIDSDSDNNE